MNLCCRFTWLIMGCHTDTVLLGSTKNIRNVQRRATMEPLNTPALMLTEALVRPLPVHSVIIHQ